jgi:hypothetical protein
MMMSNLVIFTSMFIVQYAFMSYIMTDKIENITNSIGKVYMSTIMGLIMVIMMNHTFDIQQFTIFGGLLIVVLFLYKIQFGINDKNYLNEMIEHHSMALLTSEAIIKKTNNSYVADIAQRIRNTQEKEIYEMRNLIRMI